MQNTTTRMRAAVNTRYGPPDVVRIVDDLPLPVAGPDQVLVRVTAAAVTSADSRIRAARFPRGFGAFARLAFGIRRPRRQVLGSSFAGTVLGVGAKVTDLTVGDRVCGMTGARMGCHADHLAVDRKRITRIPDGVDDNHAAGALFGGSTALHFFRTRVGVGKGMSVLVVGGSGAVGSAAIQLARHVGATVTAVTGPTNLTLARQLGATTVIDHTTTDITGLAERFDVVLDTVGTLSPATGKPLLTERGVLQLAVADLGQTITARGRVQAGSAPEKPADFEYLLDLVADGTLTVVFDGAVGRDGVVALDDIADAYRRIDSGRKIGTIIVRP